MSNSVLQSICQFQSLGWWKRPSNAGGRQHTDLHGNKRLLEHIGDNYIDRPGSTRVELLQFRHMDHSGNKDHELGVGIHLNMDNHPDRKLVDSNHNYRMPPSELQGVRRVLWTAC